MRPNPKTRRAIRRGISERRSGFEERFEQHLKARGVKYAYEKEPVFFTPPLKVRKKTFDWFITRRDGSELIVETKGWWEPADRLAETQAIAQNPDKDIRYVFQNAYAKIRKGSPTTYAAWCDRNGIPWAHQTLPDEWLDEA